MSQTSSVRVAAAALLGTVQTTASTVTNTLDSVNAGVNMLSRFIKDASAKQEIDSKLALANYSRDALARAAQHDVERQDEVRKFIGQSEWHGKTFEASYNEFKALLDA